MIRLSVILFDIVCSIIATAGIAASIWFFVQAIVY